MRINTIIQIIQFLHLKNLLYHLLGFPAQ